MSFSKDVEPSGQSPSSATSNSDLTTEDSLSLVLSTCKIDDGKSCHSSLPGTGAIDDNVQIPIFRFPYEVRAMIYWWSIQVSRTPSPEQIYHEAESEQIYSRSDFNKVWKDRPSPLLSVSRQVRQEVIDLLKHQRKFTMRITHAGAAFDMLSLSCFIAMGLPQMSNMKFPAKHEFLRHCSLHILDDWAENNLPSKDFKIQIEIWPPVFQWDRHSDEMNIFISLESLECYWYQINGDERYRGPPITLLFMESNICKWSGSGELNLFPKNGLVPRYDYSLCENYTMLRIFDYFFCKSWCSDNFKVRLPPSLENNDEVQNYVSLVVQSMAQPQLQRLFKDKDDPIMEHHLILSKFTQLELRPPDEFLFHRHLNEIERELEENLRRTTLES